MVFKKHGKPSNNRSHFGPTPKRADRDRRASKRIAGRKHRTTAVEVTAEFNQYLNSPVSIKTVRYELNKAGYRGTAAIRKPLLSTISI